MGIPPTTTSKIPLGPAVDFVLFSSSGNVRNPSPTTNPSIIQSGAVSTNNGIVSGFPPYNGTFSPDSTSNPIVRASFGIYNDGVLVDTSIRYKQESLVGNFFTIVSSCVLVNNNKPISVKAMILSLEGSIIVTNRNLYAIRLHT
jgi:hypothetical protein